MIACCGNRRALSRNTDLGKRDPASPGMLFVRGVFRKSRLQQIEKIIGGSDYIAACIGSIDQHVGQVLCKRAVTSPSLSLAREFAGPAADNRRHSRTRNRQLFKRLLEKSCRA